MSEKDKFMDEEHKLVLEEVKPLFESEDTAGLRAFLKDKRSSDIAEIVPLLNDEQRMVLFNVLDKHAAAEVLAKTEEATRAAVFELLSEQELKSIFIELDPDDAADLLAELPTGFSNKVLGSMPADAAAEIHKLMSYIEDSAGGIMDPVVISVQERATVSEAIEQIRNSEVDEDFYSVYVVDKDNTFLGDVRIRLLLTSRPDTKMKQLVDPDTIYVVADDDQERVRNVFSRNDLIVVPVLDRQHRLIGRITADRIIEVAEEEAAEDMYAMAGTDPDELENFSALHAARIRMTWLLPCLIGTGITAVVLIFFDRQFHIQNLSAIYKMAFVFVPMIAAISGNAGLQTSTIVVSGLATGHLVALKFVQVLTREVRIALFVALSCGLIGGLVFSILIHTSMSASVLYAPARLIFAFGTAMFAAIMVATTLGLILPFLFRRVGIDPAISSGPLVTTANDSISVSIYMALTLMLAG